MNPAKRLTITWIIISIFCFSSIVKAQSFRNEWIDYNKTYYRFAVTPSTVIPTSTSGPLAGNHDNLADYNTLYRIPYDSLVAAGLQSVQVEHFQLWRNGVQVPIYTYPSSGIMGTDGFIEVWGQHNDGKTDRDLYRSTSSQSNDRWSMFSDTAWYYLTVNPAGGNLRITDAPNNALASSLVPDSFFMHTITVSPRTNRNLGSATPISGQEVRSSTFDVGEGWATRRTGSVYSVSLSNLFPFNNAGSTISVRFSMQGAGQLQSNITLELNDSAIGTKLFRNYRLDSAFYSGIPVSRINNTSNGTTIIDFNSATSGFNYQLSKIQFTYPRKFVFQKTDAAFVFSLSANSSGNLLKIVNFDNSASPKIMIDLTNMRRYTAVVVADTLWFELEPSATARNLVLTTLNSANSSLLRKAGPLTPRNFLNFANTSNQGNYLIISNKKLYNDNGVNRVEEYRAYRSSANGGGYSARIYDIEELTEQFAFNILKHPLAIRNFLRYARTYFTSTPKSVFLIGRGASYEYAIGNVNAEFLNLVPTWGHPASDNLLAADNNEAITPATPIGRLGAITGAEVKAYLDKVIAFEAIQNTPESYKAWQKQTLHLIGGNDANIVDALQGYMEKYTSIIKDTLVGANVSTYERLNNPNTAANNAEIQNAVKEGVGLISYFGHSSATSIDFNLNNPSELEMTTGRLPVFIANGCKASDFFDLNTLRYNQTRLTLSEKFVLAKDKGAIAFLSSTHYGILQWLDRFTERWYKAAANTRYGKSLGEIHQETIKQLLFSFTTYDQNARLTAEEYHLHGDPALRIYPLNKPDYTIDSSSIVYSPSPASIATDSVHYSFSVRNDGKAVNDTFKIRIIRKMPDNSERPLTEFTVGKLANKKEFSGSIPIRGASESGANAIRIELDFDNKSDEYVETNNSATRSFTIQSKGLTPILPAAFGIVNSWPINLVASTFDAGLDSGLYRMELDTTALFNSPQLYSLQDSSRNGVVSFSPTNTLLPGKAYYWRTAQISNGITGPWRNSSFTYRPGDGPGFNQGHFYQHTQSAFRSMHLDSATRRYYYDAKPNNLYIVHGIYPTSAGENLQFSVTANGKTDIYSACIGRSIIFNVFDSLSFAAFTNPTQLNEKVGGCAPNSPGKIYNFEFPYYPASNRKRIMDFMDSLPTGHYVVARLVVDPPHDSMQIKYWLNDTAIYGSGNSLYHRFYNQAFYGIDSLNSPRTFSVVYRQNDTTNFKTEYILSDGLYDLPVLSVDIPMIDTTGTITSPFIGPAKSWASLSWRPTPGFVEENGLVTDSIKTYVFGKKVNGSVDTLFTLTNTQDVDFTGTNSIDPVTYPYLQIAQKTNDSDNATPAQLDYWRVYYESAPEGALSPGEYFHFTPNSSGIPKDTLLLYLDTIQLGVAFRNISETAYGDSLQVNVHIEDSAGNKIAVLSKKIRPLIAGDSLHVYVEIPTIDQMRGSMKLYVSVNGNGQQPELSLLNNSLYHEFYVISNGYIPGTKVFNGTGNWSDAAQWLPVGVPACTDKVRINGNCTVDINNAVSDSLLINTGGTLNFQQANAKLNVGCSETGGNKLVTVLGTLNVVNGTLQINGGLLFENGSNFNQSGGDIILDPNAADAGQSLKVGISTLSESPNPMATLSFGGPEQAPGKHALGTPYTTGSVTLSGGNITFVDPPVQQNSLSLYWNQTGTASLVLDSAHTTIFGSGNLAALNMATLNQFVVKNGASISNTESSLGSVVVRTANVPNREVIVDGQYPYILWIKGRLVIEDHSILRVLQPVDLRILE